jgi:hypothetical protein
MPSARHSLAQPRPIKGIFMAITIMNWTLASSGKWPCRDTLRHMLDIHARLGRYRAVACNLPRAVFSLRVLAGS